MNKLTGVRERGSAGARNSLDERGSALVTVLVLVIVLTLIGTAMLSVTLTEITIAFNHADAAVARDLADAGVARAARELGAALTWPGTGGPVTEGDGTYDVTVVATGSARYFTSTGIRGGGRQVLRGGLKAIPRSAINTVFANTTATIGTTTSGLTISNTMSSPDATAVHANNILVAATAMTVDTAGATVIAGLTSNGAISGVTCASWPWRCNTAFGSIPLPRLDVDSGASSLKARAQATFDGGKSRYFRGGDTSSGGCKNAPGYNFGLGQTQRCWDKYVSDHGGVIGSGISNAVFFVESGAGERTRYTVPGAAAPAFRDVEQDTAPAGDLDLNIRRPPVVANDVMVATIVVRGDSTIAITPPVGWTTVNIIDNGTTIRMAIYIRVATAAEPADYTWIFSANVTATGGIQAYSGVDTVSPVDDAAGQATPSGTSHSTPSISTTAASSMLVASFAVAADALWTPPAGMTEQFDIREGGAAANATSGTDEVQATAGATGAKTATSNAAGVGVTHILALRPTGPSVDCVGYASATETLCLRSRAATDSNNAIVHANSDLRQVTGAVVMFRRGTGTAVGGVIVMESLSLRTSNYAHTSLGGDPALVAGGRVEVISSGAPSASRTVEVIGIVYTFAGQDNPNVSGNLLGSTGVGIDIQHGADLVTLTFHGMVISNGSIALRDTASNAGSVAIHYDAAVADLLPAVFTASSSDNIVFPTSWSSGD